MIIKNKIGENNLSYSGISLKGNEEQIEFARLICENDSPIIMCEGAAGTGKNYVAIATSLELYFNKKYPNLYYTRSPIQVGPQVGYLPGDIDEKINPFMCPLMDTIDSIVKKSDRKFNANDLLSKWKIVPMSFIRGRNLDGILIVDEAQNLSLTEIQTLCTRLNNYSKIIFIGSFRQIDNPAQKRKDKCDYEIAMDALKGLNYVKQIKLVKSMRSPWCAEIDNIFEDLKNKQ